MLKFIYITMNYICGWSFCMSVNIPVWSFWFAINLTPTSSMSFPIWTLSLNCHRPNDDHWGHKEEEYRISVCYLRYIIRNTRIYKISNLVAHREWGWQMDLQRQRRSAKLNKDCDDQHYAKNAQTTKLLMNERRKTNGNEKCKGVRQTWTRRLQ